MVAYQVGSSSPLGWILPAIVALLLVASWVVLAGSRFVQGGIVEHPQRVPQLYGYTACLIALILGLVSLKSVVEGALTLADPAHASATPWADWSQPSVTSFEAFRVTYDRAREMRAGPDQARPEPLPENELQRRYEAMRADRIAQNRVAAKRSLVIDGFMLALAIAIFAVHWRWLRGPSLGLKR